MEGTQYTIDELARTTGTTARTIRSYQDRGLLPPPVIIGRTGRYDGDHIVRLRVIARLLDERFSLASIGALFHAWETGESLAHILGFVEDLGGDPADRSVHGEPAEHTDLGRAAPTDGRRPGLPHDAAAAVPAPRRVTTAELVAAGVPVDVVLAEVAQLRADCARIADRFIAMVEAHVPPRPGPGGAGPVASPVGADLVAALPAEVAALLVDVLPDLLPAAVPIGAGDAGRGRRVGTGIDDRTNERALGDIDLTGNAVIADLGAGGPAVARHAPPTH